MFYFSANPNVPYMYCTQFQIEFPLFWTFKFSANLDWPYINNVHNIPLNFRSSGYSIFLQIQTLRTYNIHNFQFNFRSSGHSTFLQIQTFRMYIMYTIFRWIFEVWDIQFFCKSRNSVQKMYTFSHRIFANQDFQIFYKARHSVHIMYTISR